MAMQNKCCCNCIHCERREEKGHVNTYCTVDGHYIGYIQCFEIWCGDWKLDPWQVEPYGGDEDA